MSRSGYSEDLEPWDMIRWRGAVTSAVRGRRGQAFLREMAQALDALPTKRLIEGALVQDGQACAIGAVALARGLDVSGLDPTDSKSVAEAFGIAPALAREIVYENDECGSWRQSPEERWHRMRQWVRGCLTCADAAPYDPVSNIHKPDCPVGAALGGRSSASPNKEE